MDLKTRRSIRVRIESRMKAGERKQDIYEDLKEQFGDDPFIRKVLAEVPSLEIRTTYARHNQTLVVLLVTIAAVKVAFVLAGMTSRTPGTLPWLLLPIGLQLILILMILGWNRMSYLLTAIYGGLQLFDQAPSGPAADQIIRTLFGARQFLWAVAIALSLYLYFKLRDDELS